MTTASPGDRVALVAGASRGLGLLVATELAARGMTVHGCARDAGELDRARALVDERAGAGRYVAHVCDVGDAGAVRSLVADVVADSGRIDVAIHVAGNIQVGPVESLTLGHFHDAIDTMLWGPVHLTLAVLPSMREAGHGRIGIVSSVGGVVSVPHLVPYSVAKFGAVGLAEGMYAALAGSGVTVTSVVPGLMRTGGHLAADFVGDADADYAWFAPGASLPGLSMSADHAAARIVKAVLAGKPAVELTPLAHAARIAKGVAPRTTVRLLGVVGRALPEGPDRGPDLDDSSAPAVPGRDVRRRSRNPIVEALSVLGTRAGRRNNERL
ncbi:MAG: SDR family NAD(P)-dependent oxidoreductase [Dermatophilaceae bacterium]